MKKLVVDTNILLRFLLKDVPDQADEAEALLISARNGEVELIIPQIVIFEIVFRLLNIEKYKKAVVIDKLQTILATPYVVTQDRDTFNVAIRLFANSDIEFVDCFLISYAQVIGGDVVTFDQKLKKSIAKNA